jgi:ABC-type transport system substrate-binding protein
LEEANMVSRPALIVALLLFVLGPAAVRAGPTAPDGQLTWAIHVSLAPTWFDPGETPGVITPFMVLYALHDALVKPMPGGPRTASLAESWSVSKDLAGNLIRQGSAAFGNAATRIEAFVASGGMFAYGSAPDLDGLFREQAGELDPKRREAILHRLQQLVHERAMFAPIMAPAFLNGYGPRVAESGLGLITDHIYSAPYEDLKLKGRGGAP